MKRVIKFVKIKRLLTHFWMQSRISRSSYHIWTEDSSNAPLSHTNDDGTDNTLIKFDNYPNIKTIKQYLYITSKFSLQPVSVNDVK